MLKIYFALKIPRFFSDSIIDLCVCMYVSVCMCARREPTRCGVLERGSGCSRDGEKKPVMVSSLSPAKAPAGMARPAFALPRYLLTRG